MNKNLRKLIIAIMTFGSFSIILATSLAVYEVATQQTEFSIYDFAGVPFIFGFGLYVFSYTLKKVITGEEFE